MINPKMMCKRHLLGEHYECHMFAGCLNKGKSLKGYLNNNLFDPASLTKRHDELVEEMGLRGYAHNSPIADYTGEPNPIDVSRSLANLLDRCLDCRRRHDSLAEGIV